MATNQSEITLKSNDSNKTPLIGDVLDEKNNNLLPIDKILYSKSMTKIIKFLAENQESNITQITKSCGINHKTVKNHVKFLEESQIITIKRYGRIIIYSLNKNNQNSKIVTLFQDYALKEN